jgi:hypothetical protein
VNAARNRKLTKANFVVVGLDFFARDWCPSIQPKLTNVTVVLVADGESTNSSGITFVNA